MIDRMENELRTHRAALSLRTARQELLASNIANADTPQFKARDIDFAKALAASLAGRGRSDVSLVRTHSAHLEVSENSGSGTFAQYRQEFQSSADGNTVNMDIERAAFAENALRLEATMNFISGKLRTMQSAIQGQ